ncbi:MAG TPA: hypothetical protein PK253_07250 [Spirochaetota bacterium]|nr:hypothetical protein [Spirochaetota bacterium]
MKTGILHLIEKKISAISMALIFLCLPAVPVHGGMPFTETINTLPEGAIETLFRVETIRSEDFSRRERFGIGFGILPRLSLWYSVEYCHSEPARGGGELGDSFLRIWYYCGEFFRDRLHVGISSEFRIPTGMNAYVSPKWRNLSFGNPELKLGPVVQLDMGHLYFHGNLFYVLRAAYEESFYSGFSANPVKSETWGRFFGLNPGSEEAFLYKDRLKNDYTVVSIAVNTDHWYPVLPYCGIYSSSRVYKRRSPYDELPIEGAGAVPVIVFAGVRYFISYHAYAGIYGAVNLHREEKYIKEVAGFNFSLQF